MIGAVRLRLAEDSRRQAWIETGAAPLAYNNFTPPAAELTEADRALLLAHSSLLNDLVVDRYPETAADWQQVVIPALVARIAAKEAADGKALQEAIARAQELLELGEDDREILRFNVEVYNVSKNHPLYAEFEALQKEFNRRKKALQDRVDDEARLRRLEREAQERIEREGREAAKRDWIAERGSARLQRANAGGYDCQRLYVEERAAVEAPGYRPDFDELAEWKERACPTEAALDEADRVGGFVVWLKYPVWRLDEYEEFESCEAVVLQPEWWSGSLIRIVE